MNDPLAALQARCEIELAQICAKSDLTEAEKEFFRLGFIAGASFGIGLAKQVYAEEA